MIIIHVANILNNASLQIGDFAYYVDNVGTNGLTNSQDTPIYIGKITNFGPTWIEVDEVISPTFNPDTMFLMFSKDTRANNTSLLGYFAEVTLVNNSEDAAEIFGVSSEITLSSK